MAFDLNDLSQEEIEEYHDWLWSKQNEDYGDYI